MRIGYAEMRNSISNRVAFKGHSVTAEKAGQDYIIKSYGTVVAYFEGKEKKWVINAHKYSATTSRITNLVKEVVKDFELQTLEFFNEKFQKTW